MASLFGAVATEVGETVTDLAQQRRDDRLADEERMHQLQLDKQRRQFEASELDRRISADDRRESRRQEFETDLFDQETARRQEEQEAEYGQRTSEAELKAQTDVLTTFISSYMRSNNQRSLSGNGWRVQFDERQGFDPMTGQPVFTEIVNATAPSGRPYRVMGDKAFPAGEENPQVYPFQSVEQQRMAEAALYEGRVTVEQFRDDFGYIPADYIFGRVSQEEQGLRTAIESAGIQVPAWMQFSQPSAPATQEPASTIPPATEEPEADDAKPPPKPEPEKAGDLTGGVLSEGAAATGAGNLSEKPNPYGFSLNDTGEITDADAAEVAQMVNDGMNYRLGGTL